jgi:hypothetical protein
MNQICEACESRLATRSVGGGAAAWFRVCEPCLAECEAEVAEFARDHESTEREAAVLAERTGGAFNLGAEIERVTNAFNAVRRGS